MSDPRPGTDPAMERWITDQLKRYKPSDLDAAIAIMRSIERTKCDDAQRGAA